MGKIGPFHQSGLKPGPFDPEPDALTISPLFFPLTFNNISLYFMLLVQSVSTVGLQLESGERLVKEFPSSSSVWDVLSHWDSDQDRLVPLA